VVGHDDLGQRTLEPTNAAHHAINLVAGAKGCYTRADLFHNACHIKTQHRGQRLVGISCLPGTDLGVQRIHATCMYAHQHLTC